MMNRQPLSSAPAPLRNNSTMLNKVQATGVSTIEQLTHRLCVKIASVNNLNEKARDELVNARYHYLIKLFSSDAYASQAYDTFEVAEKIKKKRKPLKSLS